MITNNQDSLNMMQNENDEGETVEVAMLSSGEETVEKSNLTMLSSVNSNAEVDADTKLGELKNDSTIRDAIMTPLFADTAFKTKVDEIIDEHGGTGFKHDEHGYYIEVEQEA